MQVRSKIPDDVERVVKGYTYREDDNGLKILISGDQIIYRGRKILGLRSNIVKKTFFDSIRGELKSDKATVVFSASDAEWDLSPTSSLELRQDVEVIFNGKKIKGIKKASLNFRLGVLETTTNRKNIYHFR